MSVVCGFWTWLRPPLESSSDMHNTCMKSDSMEHGKVTGTVPCMSYFQFLVLEYYISKKPIL